MAIKDGLGWSFNRQVNVTMIVQLILLALLIIGSWANLQSRLDRLSNDVAMLLKCQEDTRADIRSLSEKSITYEYRLRSLEKQLLQGDYDGRDM